MHRRPCLVKAALVLCCAAQAVFAQAPAVAVTAEPHHHLAFSNEDLRIFDVNVPARTSTLLHEHDLDYLWVALGASEFINAIPGRPATGVTAADASLHFSRGPFAHVARNEGATDFRNVTVELLHPQTNPRNLCEVVLADQPAHCPSSTPDEAEYRGAAVRPAFETDQIRATILRLEPNATLKIAASKRPPVLIVLDGPEVPASLHYEVSAEEWITNVTLYSGGVHWSSPNTDWTVRNDGKSAVRFLALQVQAISH